MPVYKHRDGGLYQRLDECGVALGPTGGAAYWIPDRDLPAGRGSPVILYVPEGGRMPDDLASQGFGAYATPLSRWARLFVDATPPISATVQRIHAMLNEAWVSGPCEVDGCENVRCRPWILCWPHVRELGE